MELAGLVGQLNRAVMWMGPSRTPVVDARWNTWSTCSGEAIQVGAVGYVDDRSHLDLRAGAEPSDRRLGDFGQAF